VFEKGKKKGIHSLKCWRTRKSPLSWLFFGLPLALVNFVPRSTCEKPHWLGKPEQIWFSRALPLGGNFLRSLSSCRFQAPLFDCLLSQTKLHLAERAIFSLGVQKKDGCIEMTTSFFCEGAKKLL